MEISDIQISLAGEQKLKAYASITIDRCFVIRDLKIIQGTNGLFVAMPAKKRKDGSFRDIAHPIHKEMREKLEAMILEAYQRALSHQVATSHVPAVDATF